MLSLLYALLFLVLLAAVIQWDGGVRFEAPHDREDDEDGSLRFEPRR